MYIKCLIAAIGLVSMPVIAAEQTTPLLPEVAKILEITVDEQAMDNNAYVALLGINAPDGLDYKAVGKAYILAATKQLQQAIQQGERLPSIEKCSFYQGKQPIHLNTTADNFPCSRLTNLHCVKETLTKRAELQQAIARDKVLLERYQQILALPNYDTYFSSTEEFLSTMNVSIPDISTLQLINLFQVIELIDKSNIEQGLDILQQEINFSKRILTSKNTSQTYDRAMQRLVEIYHVINELLDTPQLANHLTAPKLVALLKPFTVQEQQAIIKNFLEGRRNTSIIEKCFLKEQRIKEIFEHYASTKEIDYVKEHNIPFKFNCNMAQNIIYKNYQTAIEKITKANITEIKQVLKIKEDILEEIEINNQAYREYVYNKYGADNFFTHYYADNSIPLTLGADTYSLQSYIVLINIKLQIKQAAINKDQVPTFLAKLGEQASNPYTKQPFDWDPQKQILATENFKNYRYFRSWVMGKIQVYIDFAQ